MSYKKTPDDLLQQRLDEIQMPSYERLVAQAHLARAEAIADLIVGAVNGLKALAKAFARWRVRTLAKIG
jgi:predicted MarR family transcription regulator